MNVTRDARYGRNSTVTNTIHNLPLSPLQDLWSLTWNKPHAYPTTTLTYQNHAYEFIKCTPALELLFPTILPEWILVREEWKLVLDGEKGYPRTLVKARDKPRKRLYSYDMDDNIAISGGSGTGKSVFLVYILIRRLSAALPTVIQYANDALVYFNSTGVQTFTFNSDFGKPAIADLPDVDGVWCLVRFSWSGKRSSDSASNSDAGGGRCGVVDDPRKTTTFSWRKVDAMAFAAGMVFTMTPGVSPGYREWMKEKWMTRCILDPWKRREIGALLTQLGLDVDRGLELFDKYGPCPRTILTILLSSPHDLSPPSHLSYPPTPNPTEISHLTKTQLGTSLLVQSILAKPFSSFTSSEMLTFLHPDSESNIDDRIKILDPEASDERIERDPEFCAASRSAWEVLWSVLVARPGRHASVSTRDLLSRGCDDGSVVENEEKAGEGDKPQSTVVERLYEGLYIPTPFLVQCVARAVLDKSPENQREFFLRVDCDSPMIRAEPCTCLDRMYPDLISLCGSGNEGEEGGVGGVKPTLKTVARWIFRNMVLARVKMAVEEGCTLECVGENGERVEFGLSHDVHDDGPTRTATGSSGGSLATQNTTKSIPSVSPRQPCPPVARPIFWTPTPGSSSLDLPGVDILVLLPTPPAPSKPSIRPTPPTYDLYVIQALPSLTIPELCCEAEEGLGNDALHERLLHIRRDEWMGRDCMPVDEAYFPSVVSFAGMRTRRSLLRIVECVRGVRGVGGGNVEGGEGGVVGVVGRRGEEEERDGSSGKNDIQPPPTHTQTWKDLLTAHTIAQIKFVVVCPGQEVPQGYMDLLRGKLDDMVWATLPEDVMREVDVYASLFEFGSVRAEDVLRLMRGEGGERGRL